MKTEQANTSETSDPWSLEDPVNRRLVQRGMRLPRGRHVRFPQGATHQRGSTGRTSRRYGR